MRILGIDPGFSVTGFGIMKKEGQMTVLCEYGDLRMSSSQHLAVRVGRFYDFFAEKIVRWQITDIALETSFLGKNAQTFLKLGYLRGIVYLLASQHNLNLHEYTPREVKQAVTGFGGAGKDQVARIMLQLFPKVIKPEKQDVTDALAVTLCGLWRLSSVSLR